MTPDRAREDIREAFLTAGVPAALVEGCINFTLTVNKHFQSRRGAEVLDALAGHIMKVTDVKQEDRPVGCSLIVGDTIYLADCLPAISWVRPPVNVSTATGLEQLFEYYDAHDEENFAFCFDYDGNFHSIRRLHNNLFGSGLDVLIRLTEDRSECAFHAKKWQRSFRVYANGALDLAGVMIEKSGAWDFRSYSPEVTGRACEGTKVTDKLYLKVLDLAVEMTHFGYGGLILLGDANDNLGCESPKLKLDSKHVNLVPRRDFMDIAKQDGCTSISSKGDIEKASFLVRNKPRKLPREYDGRGRHSAAYKTSKEQPQLIVIVISQNKKITVLRNGEKIA